jgi:hypothetical protein
VCELLDLGDEIVKPCVLLRRALLSSMVVSAVVSAVFCVRSAGVSFLSSSSLGDGGGGFVAFIVEGTSRLRFVAGAKAYA